MHIDIPGLSLVTWSKKESISALIFNFYLNKSTVEEYKTSNDSQILIQNKFPSYPLFSWVPFSSNRH